MHRKGTAVVARIQGEMDLRTADDLRAALDQEIDRGCPHLVLNLKRVSFIDSSGLGVILGRYRRLRSLGGKLTLVGPSPHLKPVLDLSGILGIMDVADDEAEVVRGG